MQSNEIKQELRKALPEAKLSVRQKRECTVVTFVEYPHNLVSLGAVVNSIIRPDYTDIIDLPWSSDDQINSLLSREGKRTTKVVLSHSCDAPVIVTVDSELWWRHYVQRSHELGVLPKLRSVDARLRWKGVVRGWLTKQS